MTSGVARAPVKRTRRAFWPKPFVWAGRLRRTANFALFALACSPTRGSIGAVLAQKRDGRLTVREAPADLPAARAGLATGDEILLIDGRDVRRLSPLEIHTALEGDVGTEVRLTVLREGAIERLSLTRAPFGSGKETAPRR